MKRDVKLPAGLDDLAGKDADADKLAEFFERYGMKTMLREIRGQAPAPAAVAAPEAPSASEPMERRKYLTLSNETELSEFVAKLDAAELVGFDTETTGLEPMIARLVGMSFAFGDTAWYLPLAHEYPGAPDQIGVEKALKLLKGWLESARHKKVGQNLKFDAHILANHGLTLGGMGARHAAGILRLRGARAPRHGLDGGAPPGLENHHLRRSHRQGRLPHPLLRGRDRTRDGIRGRGRGFRLERACGPLREDFPGRKN